jgi:hypothetical protein
MWKSGITYDFRDFGSSISRSRIPNINICQEFRSTNSVYAGECRNNSYKYATIVWFDIFTCLLLLIFIRIPLGILLQDWEVPLKPWDLASLVS